MLMIWTAEPDPSPRRRSASSEAGPRRLKSPELQTLQTIAHSPPSRRWTIRLRDPCVTGRKAGGRLRQHGQQKDADLQAVFSGSDGTRTRDIRRDGPSRAQRRSATDVSEHGHLQALVDLTPPSLRMVEPIVRATFGP